MKTTRFTKMNGIKFTVGVMPQLQLDLRG